MTVITKPLSEKKAKDVKKPLVGDTNAVLSAVNPDVESGDEPRYVILGTRAQRVSTATIVCLFLTALLVMSIGIIGGVYLYRQFARSQNHWFRGRCNIPYTASGKLYTGDELDQYRQHEFDQARQQEALLADVSTIFDSLNHVKDDLSNDMQSNERNFFPQDFEMDLETESFEKIDVPDFGDGRRGRFIHDFNTNKTGIIDLDSHRCFVMPLNRLRVLPPRSMYDLITKMWNGYYEVDTEVVRETMKVVLPPVADFTNIGQYIARECKNMHTYMLERSTGKLKRSVGKELMFAEFAGKKISEFFVDTTALDEYEKTHAGP